MSEERVARTVAGGTELRPRLAASTAGLTHSTDVKIQRHDRSGKRIEGRQGNLGRHRARLLVRSEKGIAHPVHHGPHGRKVDGDLIGEPVESRRQSPDAAGGRSLFVLESTGGFTAHVCLAPLGTIGTTSQLVKASSRCYDPVFAMQPKECPVCGESMHLVDRELSDRVPGTSEWKKRKISEWVCPECEHFEEADPADLV